MIIAFSHCNVLIHFKVEASASSAASSKLPVILIQKLSHISKYYFMNLLRSDIPLHNGRTWYLSAIILPILRGRYLIIKEAKYLGGRRPSPPPRRMRRRAKILCSAIVPIMYKSFVFNIFRTMSVRYKCSLRVNNIDQMLYTIHTTWAQ